jgi:hypothetical protein
MKYCILPEITEKKIYFADIGDLIDYKYDLQDAKKKLVDFFECYIVEYRPEDELQTQIYKAMTQEYERIEHLLRSTELRINNVQDSN